jgi:hopanoid biosynthesis associated protein HpnK
MSRQVIFTADDFGLSEAVNEGVERAHRDGLLTSASLMVGGAAVDDAVARAKRLPHLRVGLHLVVIEGPAVLPHSQIPALVDEQGQFSSDQLRLGLRYFFAPDVRDQLREEIRAQFAVFAETGLTLNHADAHKHMHLHPTVAAMMIDAGWQYGLPAIRVPSEPSAVMRACGEKPGFGAWAMQKWCSVLRSQVRAAGLQANDSVFGLSWTGAFTEERLLRLSQHLPPGLSELYFHPACGTDELLERLMPTYRHDAELAALTSTRAVAAFAGVKRAITVPVGAGAG